MNPQDLRDKKWLVFIDERGHIVEGTGGPGRKMFCVVDAAALSARDAELADLNAAKLILKRTLAEAQSELATLMKELAEALDEIEQLLSDIYDIDENPSVINCRVNLVKEINEYHTKLEAEWARSAELAAEVKWRDDLIKSFEATEVHLSAEVANFQNILDAKADGYVREIESLEADRDALNEQCEQLAGALTFAKGQIEGILEGHYYSTGKEYLASDIATKFVDGALEAYARFRRGRG